MAASPTLSATPQDLRMNAVGQVLPGAPCWWDLAAILLVLGIVILLGSSQKQKTAPFALRQASPISLSPSVLPMYAVRTTLRMLAATVPIDLDEASCSFRLSSWQRFWTLEVPSRNAVAVRR